MSHATSVEESQHELRTIRHIDGFENGYYRHIIDENTFEISSANVSFS